MSVETVVVFSRARIISPQKWQSLIADIERGLCIDTDFDPLEFSGYLPCKLLAQDCGFEYWLEPLDDHFRDELGPHFKDEWDCVLTLVTRSGFVDAQSAVIAAAAFALGAGGSVLGDDDRLLEPSSILEWARDVISSLKSGEAQARDADARREAAQAAGSDNTLLSLLSELSGRSAILNCQMGKLALVAKPDVSVRSSAWEIEIDGTLLNCSRYAAIREKQMRLLSTEDGRFQELDAQLDEAGVLDEGDVEAFLGLLTSLGEFSIFSARNEGLGQIVVAFKGARRVIARWYGMGTSPLSLRAGGLQWTITQQGASLR